MHVNFIYVFLNLFLNVGAAFLFHAFVGFCEMSSPNNNKPCYVTLSSSPQNIKQHHIRAIILPEHPACITVHAVD